MVVEDDILQGSCAPQVLDTKVLPLYSKLVDMMYQKNVCIEECVGKKIPPVSFLIVHVDGCKTKYNHQWGAPPRRIT